MAAGATCISRSENCTLGERGSVSVLKQSFSCILFRVRYARLEKYSISPFTLRTARDRTSPFAPNIRCTAREIAPNIRCTAREIAPEIAPNIRCTVREIAPEMLGVRLEKSPLKSLLTLGVRLEKSPLKSPLPNVKGRNLSVYLSHYFKFTFPENGKSGKSGKSGFSARSL